jgi:anhydro-N-acetylmuramic acid kinase
MDGIDAALVAFGNRSCTIRATGFSAYPVDMRARLQALVRNPGQIDLAEFGALHIAVAQVFAAATIDLLQAAGHKASDVTAVGSHGQTILHQPGGDAPFSIQLGDPGTLAAAIGMQVVADFRNTDLALGGQGAPLVPGFHRWAFGASNDNRAVINIGGIANITLLHCDGKTTGFDIGPGNILMDIWCNENRATSFDDDGNWARSGSVDAKLLRLMRTDPYFDLAAPKSTGAEYFNLDWLRRQLTRTSSNPSAADTQATLSELTAQEIAHALNATDAFKQVGVCGGGAHNSDLLERLRRALPDCSIDTTTAWGIDPDWVEAAAFAWLARQRLRGAPTNIPAVTGASAPVSLGGVFLPPGNNAN